MKTITICGKDYNIDCNALTYKNYRTKFNTDIFSDIRILQSFLTKQVLSTEYLKKENPNIDDATIISSLFSFQSLIISSRLSFLVSPVNISTLE